jgi:hypothetical protein
MRYLIRPLRAHIKPALTGFKSRTIGRARQCKGRCLGLLLLVALNPASLLALDGPFESLHLGNDLGENNSRLFADQSGLPQGGIIIISSVESNDQKLISLAHYLSYYGWTSLITSLPVPATDANASGTMTDAGLLALAIDFMQQQGQFNLVLLALNKTWPRLYDDGIAGRPELQGLILLDVDNTTTIDGLPKSMPVLDIATERRSPLEFASRKSDAQRYRLAEYQQISLPPLYPNLSVKENRFSKRIRGWLKRHVQGMELSGAAG